MQSASDALAKRLTKTHPGREFVVVHRTARIRLHPRPCDVPRLEALRGLFLAECRHVARRIDAMHGDFLSKFEGREPPRDPNRVSTVEDLRHAGVYGELREMGLKSQQAGNVIVHVVGTFEGAQEIAARRIADDLARAARKAVSDMSRVERRIEAAEGGNLDAAKDVALLQKLNDAEEARRARPRPGPEWTVPKFRHAVAIASHERDWWRKSEGTMSVSVLDGVVRMDADRDGYERFAGETAWLSAVATVPDAAGNSMPEGVGEWRFGTATLVERHGKWFEHVACSMAVEKESWEAMRNVVGVDRGIRYVAVAFCGDGRTMFLSGRPTDAHPDIRFVAANAADVAAEAASRKTPSGRRRARSAWRRANGSIRDALSCDAKALSEAFGPGTLFVLEDLRGIRSALVAVKKGMRREMVSWA
jgi:hypothetical protein